MITFIEGNKMKKLLIVSIVVGMLIGAGGCKEEKVKHPQAGAATYAESRTEYLAKQIKICLSYLTEVRGVDWIEIHSLPILYIGFSSPLRNDYFSIMVGAAAKIQRDTDIKRFEVWAVPSYLRNECCDDGTPSKVYPGQVILIGGKIKKYNP